MGVFIGVAITIICFGAMVLMASSHDGGGIFLLAIGLSLLGVVVLGFYG